MANSNHIMQTAANASTATTAVTGTATASMSFASWVSSNSILIGVICTVLSLIAALVSVKNSDDMQWSPNLDLMSEDYKFRIKPRKEKRWVVCSPVDGDVCDQLFTSKPDINAFGESCQVVEIEVEV